MPPSGSITPGVYLRSYLAPLVPLLDRQDVTDLYVNRPGEIWIETLGGSTERHESPSLDAKTLARLSEQIAAWSNQGISREQPLLSASLPGGARIQIVAPPATRGSLALAIRKQVSPELSLTDYVAAGSFAGMQTRTSLDPATVRDGVADLLDSGDPAAALALAVRERRTILISGGTSTGKTTFLNALMREIPQSERLILIEDTPEMELRHVNAVALLASRSALREAAVTADDLVTAALRMRPDRIILGELRGPEAYAFLRAINTGHPGSMATVHANSAEGAIEQITLLVLQSSAGLTRDDVRDYVRRTVGVFVQLARKAGRRLISSIIVNDACQT